MKKKISVLLSMILLISIFPVSSIAEEVDLTDGDPAVYEVWMENKADEVIQTLSMQMTTPSSTMLSSDVIVSSGTEVSEDVDGISGEINRYTVLVLDTSGSMNGTPVSYMKSAAIKFCESVLEADGNNMVAVVSYASYGYTRTGFTEDLTTLRNTINYLYASGNTNVTGGLNQANTLLDSIPNSNNTVKNILLLSDGVPSAGPRSTSGPYTYSDFAYYQYANASYNLATEIKAKDYNIYTLGFFHTLSGYYLEFAERFMNDLQNAGYYNVVNVGDLEFVFGKIANQILKKTGLFSYQSGISDYQARYYYTDEYFFDKADNYNNSLATMTLCLAMSAFATSDDVPYTQKSKNVKALLTDIGFEDFDTNTGYQEKPTMDSIGAVVANKVIEVDGTPFTLLAIAVRGGGYESEWASNFTIGRVGQHDGFDLAKDNVLEFVNEYVEENNITGDVKIWLTGFSRAAATSNLLAGALNQGAEIAGCNITTDNVYAYTFETPAGAVSSTANSEVYDNIFNIINYNDPVTKVAPAALGFRRYGADKRLPDPLSDSNYSYKLVEMLSMYNSLPSTDGYIIDDFTMKKIDIDFSLLTGLDISIVDDEKNAQIQGVFLDTFITKLVKEQIKNRNNYVDEYQNGIREVFGILNGTEDEQWETFNDEFEKRMSDNVGVLVASTSPLISPFTGTTTELIEEYAVESLNEAGITGYTAEQINEFAATIAKTVIEFAVKHPNLTTTLIQNIKGIGAAHYPELCLAWLQSSDENYTTDVGDAFTSGNFRVVRINCPVDVEVVDSSNGVVASIVNDIPQSMSSSSIVSLINNDGEKVVYLPANADYHVNILATGEGTMSVSLQEYSSHLSDITRLVNYYDVPLTSGATFELSVPAFSESALQDLSGSGSSVEYYLMGQEDVIIPSDVDILADIAREAYFLVDVSTNDDTLGRVTGYGIRELGSYARLEAFPYDNGPFAGWYTDGELLSEESVYEFRVESDVAIVAVFNQPPDVSNATASIPVIWPPNNKLVDISIEGIVDPDGDDFTVEITSVSQNEALTNDVEGDAVINGENSVSVRACRDGEGRGRFYVITFTATDIKGGSTDGKVYVRIHHDKRVYEVFDIYEAECVINSIVTE